MIPTVKTIKRRLKWLDKTEMGDKAATIIRQAMEFWETGNVRPTLRRFAKEQNFELVRRDVSLIFDVMDRACETFGSSYVASKQDTFHESRGFEYLNTGHTYVPTIVYDYETDHWFITSWGNIVERDDYRFGE